MKIQTGPTFLDWLIFFTCAHGAYRNPGSEVVIFPVVIMLIQGATILIKIKLQELYQAWEAKQPKQLKEKSDAE